MIGSRAQHDRSGERAVEQDRVGVRAVASQPQPALPPEAPAKLAAYLDLLAKWNRVYNLTAIRERERMESHHVRDALSVLPYLPPAPGTRLIDVGSGGGIPGIPLAIARPDWEVTLVDANRKKTAFLAQAAIELGLANVHVITARIEHLESQARFDVVISRAFSDLRTFAVAASRCVDSRGIIVAMKGALAQEEIDALPQNVVVTAMPSLEVPGIDAQRHLVIMRVARESP